MPKIYLTILNTLLTIAIIFLAIYLMMSPVIPEVQLYIADLVREETDDSPTAFRSKYADPQLIEKELANVPSQNRPDTQMPSQDSENELSRLPVNILNPTSIPMGSLPTPTESPSFFGRLFEPFSADGEQSTPPQPIVGGSENNGEGQSDNPSSIPQRNVLLIPQIGVDGLVYEGTDPTVLNYGIWRRPNTSTPDKGGNTVFVAHRYLYTTGINTFYHLPKMEVGDEFVVFWEGQQYIYEVFTTETVLPTQTEIEENTQEPIVTLYTCTPLWSSEYRFVVKARPV